ncbi:MAG: thermonuclease family protein, partial [Xanthobacteraceae bacterium]
MKTIPIAFAAWLVCSPLQAAELSGAPRVVDGDTLVVSSTKVRLEGIDAPESDQVCLDANGRRWACGIEARDRLATNIGNRSIECTPSGLDAYGRTLAVCTADGEDLNAWRCVKDG